MSRQPLLLCRMCCLTLKQSVEKLSLDNDQLAASDNAIKQQISQLQTQLGQLQAQGDVFK